MPETWSEDPERRRTAGVPEEVVFRMRTANPSLARIPVSV
jgi:hypothetical protein